MAYVFEAFVRNFYRKELKGFTVKRENLTWMVTALDEISAQYLPQMQTDVSLISSDRHIVIDTKYYKEALQTYYGKQSIRPDNLNQLNSYLDNLTDKDGVDRKHEGMLLYPAVDYDFKFQYDFKGKQVTVTTIDLSKDWNEIHKALLDVLK
jgi:5-methylcytosine-specific restriction enzyme subunit McrC